MRRFLVALATAAAVTVTGTAVATAQTSQGDLTDVSSQVSSRIADDTEDLPEWSTMGSSGSSLLSSADRGERVQGSSLIARDWLVGLLAATAFGTIVNALFTVLPSR